MVIAPDAVRFEDPLMQADLIGKVITHCEQFRRFAIIDAPTSSDDQDLADWRNATVSSTYAAVYAPHLKIVTIDPDSHRPVHNGAAVRLRCRRLRAHRSRARRPQGAGQ